ncbi:hypothetical protein A7K91_00620 [Paenibacillus oryzae]|uniref:Uncharacterized protein n=1 Tax=Paenibacillus oryzae TaxID=1844972 RepID=A0A1A5YHZ2_9BACL|nr:hypothetical protein [Paenibacillus oryzae]OBR65212.1 hypothetical protein A7K91_00620 [Paenibacillus oryzae]
MKSPGGSIFPYYYKGGEIHCLSGMNQWRLKRRIKQAGIIQNISFYADPEDAKTWLISEKRG